jgi:hypothetical protein
MTSGVHSSLCDNVAGVGSLEDRLVEVDLLYVLMLDTEESKSSGTAGD